MAPEVKIKITAADATDGTECAGTDYRDREISDLVPIQPSQDQHNGDGYRWEKDTGKDDDGKQDCLTRLGS